MAIQVSRRRFNIREYERMIEDGILSEDENVELIEGEIVEMSPIGKRHAACVDRLSDLLRDYAGKSAIVRGQGPIQLPDFSEPQPDIALLRRRDDFYAGDLPIPSDVFLVVEVAETSLKNDRNVKVPLYAKAGIPEVWLIDLKNEIIWVFTQPTEGGYNASGRTRRGDSIAVEALPGVVLKVDDILG